MTTTKVECGGAGKVSDPAEHPCVRRLRHRRLLSYLSHQGFHPAFQSMILETDAHLCVFHLRQLVARGLWSEAVNYVCRFLPPDRGVEARPLLLFLHTLWAFANIVASSKDGAVMAATHRHDFALCLSICRNTKLRCIVDGIVNSSEFRASLDWELMRKKASLIAYDLALESPELRRQVILPSGPVAPHDVLPIGPPRRRRVKRRPGRPPAPTIAMLYLKKRRSLPSSSPGPGLATQSMNQVADLIVKCVKAGRSLELHQGHPLQSSAKQGVGVQN